MSILGELIRAVNRFLISSFIGGTIIWIIYFIITKVLKKKRENVILHYLVAYIFYVYLIAVFNVTGVVELRFSDFGGIGMTPNLIPLVFSITDIFENGLYVIPQMFLNIVLYLPFGLLLTLLIGTTKNKIFFKVLLLAVTFSCILESLQFFTGRYADIDDVILNVVGACLGYLIISLFIKIRNRV